MNRALGHNVSAVGFDVGFVCQGWWPEVGGVERHTHDLALGLMARGHRVHVLCVDRDPERAPYTVRTELVDGVEVRRMVAPRAHASFAALVADAKADDAVLAWLAETPCDVVHAHHVTGFGAGALRAVADMGRPLLATLHDAWLFCPCGQPTHALDDAEALVACASRHWPHLLPSGGGEPFGPEGETLGEDAQAVESRRRFALHCLSLVHRVLTPSAAARDWFAAAGVERAALRVVEHGLAVDELRQAVARCRAEGATPRAAQDGRASEVRLGVLGSVLPGKGVVELLEALALADAPALRVDVHGPLPTFHGDASALERVRERVRADARATLHGAYRPDELPRILAGLDGVAAPSTWPEVFGLSAREARAAGLPVLVSDRGGLPEAVRGGGGVVLPAAAREPWARALERFARDAAWRAELARAVGGVRSIDDMVRDTERHYAEVTLAVSGRLPSFAHPIEGLSEGLTEGLGAARAEALERRAPSVSSDTSGAPGASGRRRGFLGRLFGK